MGTLPQSGQWVQLQIPASQVGLEGRTVSGMAFTLNNGRATFDLVGKLTSASSTNNTGGSTGTNTSSGTSSNVVTTVTNVNNVTWVDDAVPSGAQANGDTDGWNWAGSGPAPQSGSVSHQSGNGAGLHQHFFQSASSQLQVNAGDILYTYVYLDPANLPTEIMLQWNNGSWEHRAYWGGNFIPWGTDASVSRRG